jgi:hypothetical protein
MSAARLHLVECRAVLGGERDPMRAVWDEQATARDRRLLLVMAGESQAQAGRHFGYSWCDLSAHTRGEVKRRLREFSAWADKLK